MGQAQQGPLVHVLREQKGPFLRAEGACLARASGLAFASLLALVPLSALLFSLFSALGSFTDLVDNLQAFLIRQLVPASEEAIMLYVRRFVENARTLGVPGLLFFLLASVFLLNTIQGTFNAVWLYGIVRGRESPQEYCFSHAVIHEAVRGRIPESQRRQWAGKLAAAVAQAHGEDPGPWALRIARWFAESRSPGTEHKRWVYLRLAAGQAMRAGAWEQAVQLFGQLVDPDLPEARSHEEAQLLQSLGRARAGTGDWPAALANMRAAFTYFKRRGDVRRMVEIALIPVFENPGEPGFFDYFDEFLPLLPEDTPQRSHVLWLYGFALFNAMADYPGAEATLRAALDAAQRVGDRITAVRRLDALALLRLRFYRFEEAVACVNEFLPRLAGLDDPLILAHSQAILGWAHKALGQPQVALECAQKTLGSSRAAWDYGILGRGPKAWIRA